MIRPWQLSCPQWPKLGVELSRLAIIQLEAVDLAAGYDHFILIQTSPYPTSLIECLPRNGGNVQSVTVGVASGRCPLKNLYDRLKHNLLPGVGRERSFGDNVDNLLLDQNR